MDWKITAPALVGLGLSLLARFPVSLLIRRVKDGIPPISPSLEMKEKWAALTADPESDKSGRVLGDLERALFFLAFWYTSWELVAAWLAFKVAAKWEAWSTTGALPEALPNTDPLSYLIARRAWASQRLMAFLIGTLANVLVAFVCVLVGKHLQAWLHGAQA